MGLFHTRLEKSSASPIAFKPRMDEVSDLRAQVAAIRASQAVIQFTTEGVIIEANDVFLKSMGYQLEDIVGQHHRMCVAPEYRDSDEYRKFWHDLANGEVQSGIFHRVNKKGDDIWIRAYYTPIKNKKGEVVKIVKYATNITEDRLQKADFQGQIEGINHAMAVIQFNTDGTIINANQNFLEATGYELHEIVGNHHRMFVEPAYADSSDYVEFWKTLRTGKAITDSFKRVGKGGKEIWITASYTPIKDFNGRVFKIVKYARDITEETRLNADYKGQIDGICASQAVIQFNPDGTVIQANDIFLNALGYTLEGIQGRHHRMFVDPAEANSPNYAKFWQALNDGLAQTGDFRRIGKQGNDVWIRATYTPIKDASGKVFKVVKYASDITEAKQTILEIDRLIAAVKEGDLQQRADTSDVHGDNRLMRENINAMLETIFTPIEEMARVMKAIAEDDLTRQVSGNYKGMMKDLKDNVNSALAQLNSSLREVQASAQTVRQSANEIADANVELSARTEEQASSLEETAATMDQMTSSVQQNATSSKHANELALSAHSVAQEGGAVIREAVEAMHGINESSGKIVNIINVIDEIAFQTNLLALNASVEAARAGDKGRGFAVVADEVRDLASRSAVSAKEIKALINESTVQVKSGAELVDRSGKFLDQIIDSVRKVNESVSEIMTAPEEQNAGIEAINNAVQEMDSMTQQNSAMVEQAAANARLLNDQAERLSHEVERFRLQ